MTTILNSMNMRSLTRATTGGLALALVAGTAIPATAQTDSQDRRERAAQNPGEWEWEPDEGFHKEEWYDPTDWFDGEQTIDYEYDWDEVGYDDDRDRNWVTGSDWYDGYWDGYNDGYNDDQYGFDNRPKLGSAYGDAYSSGYSDGYYDKDRGYTADPYYYVVTWHYDKSSDSQRERAGDRDRQRGDRARESEREFAKDRQRHESRIKRVRGEVKNIEFLRGTGSESDTDLIARVTFKEEGKKHVVNLGPKMTKDNLPFEKGDRVTFKGVKQQHEDRQVLTAYRLNVEGETVRLAAAPDRRDADTARANRRTMEGTIRSVTEVDVDSERYTLLRIQLDNGKSAVIAVSDRWADGIEAGEGDEIVIMGDERTIEGRTVIRPHRIDVNGERLSMR